MSEVKVSVQRFGDRPNLALVYIDPTSGKRKTKSAGTSNEKTAWKAAATWEEELNNGRYAPPSKITWQEFRQRFEAEHLASLKEKSGRSFRGALNHVERHLAPDRLIKVNAAALSTMQSKLRATGVKETTIASVLRHVRAALGWAASVEMLPAVPKITMPKKAKGKKMKGGALVGEQFDRLLLAVPKVRPHDAAAWVHLLTGVYLSGLRLGEACVLSWDADAPLSIDLTRRHPGFRIKGEVQKSGKDQLLPMTPDAAEFFLATPPDQRHGRVFKLYSATANVPLAEHSVGEVVTRFGKRARVVVDPTTGKTASLHDLRRSFGSRWAKRVKTPVLQRLMRHEDIQTTMRYYVDLDVDEMADDLWASHPAAGDTAAPSHIPSHTPSEAVEFCVKTA